MDLLWKFNIERPLAYYKCGRFISSDSWQHKQMRLKKDFEIIIGLKKTVYIQVGVNQYEVKQGDVLLIPPEMDYQGYAPSQKGASFFWIHFISFCETEIYLVRNLSVICLQLIYNHISMQSIMLFFCQTISAFPTQISLLS